MKKDRCQISTWDFKRVLAALHNSENICPLWDFQAGIIHRHQGRAKTNKISSLNDFVRPTKLLPCEILQAGIIHSASQSSQDRAEQTV